MTLGVGNTTTAVSGGNVTTLAVTMPSGGLAGDYVWCFVHTDDNDGTAITSPGWTADLYGESATGDDRAAAFLSKEHQGGSEASSHTFTWAGGPGSDGMAARMGIITGAVIATEATNSGTSGNNESPTSPAATAITADNIEINCFAAGDPSGVGVGSVPTGYTEIGSIVTEATEEFRIIYRINTTTGSKGGVTFTDCWSNGIADNLMITAIIAAASSSSFTHTAAKPIATGTAAVAETAITFFGGIGAVVATQVASDRSVVVRPLGSIGAATATQVAPDRVIKVRPLGGIGVATATQVASDVGSVLKFSLVASLATATQVASDRLVRIFHIDAAITATQMAADRLVKVGHKAFVAASHVVTETKKTAPATKLVIVSSTAAARVTALMHFSVLSVATQIAANVASVFTAAGSGSGFIARVMMGCGMGSGVSKRKR